MYKSQAAAFEAAGRRLGKLGYALDDRTSDFRPEHKIYGQTITWKQRSVEGTNAVVVVKAEKVTGFPTSYDIYLIRENDAMRMPLHAMDQPNDEAYHKLISG
jgi:hypothetical protein